MLVIIAPFFHNLGSQERIAENVYLGLSVLLQQIAAYPDQTKKVKKASVQNILPPDKTTKDSN